MHEYAEILSFPNPNQQPLSTHFVKIRYAQKERIKTHKINNATVIEKILRM